MKSLRPPYSQIGCMTRTDVRRFGGPSPVASAYSLSRTHVQMLVECMMNAEWCALLPPGPVNHIGQSRQSYGQPGLSYFPPSASSVVATGTRSESENLCPRTAQHATRSWGGVGGNP